MKTNLSNTTNRFSSRVTLAVALTIAIVSLTIGGAKVYAKTADEDLGWRGDDDLSWPAAHNIAWYDDYAEARSRAIADGRMLFIYFRDIERNSAQEVFETISLANPKVREGLQKFVAVRITLDERITIDGEEIRLIQHGAFAEMNDHQGVAIVDYEDAESENYGQVVSAFPFREGRYYRPHALNAMIELPTGTLTQRTMIFAVEMHPDGPRSTRGEFNAVLADEAESHSVHQARIRVQGHHSWNTRFHRISNRLSGGALPREVVAESWGGESLVDACHECVRSWRQSSGHWGAVRSQHKMFAFDIKRGSNGVWYATGIFAEGG
jgi:hypothetical protein